MLTDRERAAWARDGFLSVGVDRQLFSPLDLTAIFEEVERLSLPSETASCGRQWNYFEPIGGVQEIFRIERFLPFSPKLRDVFTRRGSALMASMQQLVGGAPLVVREKEEEEREGGRKGGEGRGEDRVCSLARRLVC